MSELPRLLVPVILGLPLVALLVRVLGTRVGIPAWFPAAGTAIAASCAAGVLAIERFGTPIEPVTLGPVRWLDVGGIPAELAFRFDTLALAWTCVAFIAATLLLVSFRGCEAAIVLGTTAMVGFVAATNLVLVLALGGVASVVMYVAVAMTDERGPNGILARRVLLHHLVGDILLLVAILYAVGRVGTLGVPDLATGTESRITTYVEGTDLPERMTSLDRNRTLEGRRGETGLIALCLLGAVVARGALFPVFGTAYDVGRLPAPVAGLGPAIVLPGAALLLVRCWGPFAVDPGVPAVARMIGGLTALLAGWSACGQREPRPAIGLAATAFVGVAITGIASSGSGAVAGQMLLFVLAVSVAAIASGVGGDRPTTAGTRLACLGGLVLVLGLVGTNALVEDRLTSGDAIVAALLLSGIAAASFALARTILGAGEPEVEDERTITVEPTADPIGPPAITPIVLLVLFGLGFWAAFDGWLPRRLADPRGVEEAGVVHGFGVATLVALPAVVGGWLMRRVDLVPRLGALGRLAEHRFYLPMVVELAFVLPVRGLSQIARFVDWFLLDGLVTGFPRWMLRSLDDWSSTLRAAPVPVAVLSLALALGGLLAAFTWF